MMADKITLIKVLDRKIGCVHYLTDTGLVCSLPYPEFLMPHILSAGK